MADKPCCGGSIKAEVIVRAEIKKIAEVVPASKVKIVVKAITNVN